MLLEPDAVIRRLCQLFADLLTYPTAELGQQARECAQLLAGVDMEAAGHLWAFVAWADETPLGRQEEIYTGTFDLQVVCYPYVGYQLFGESYKRGAFLVKLKEAYRARGFMAEDELPDHLAVMLRFLATMDDEEAARDLASECLLPALERMKLVFDGKANPYNHVIRALAIVLCKAGPIQGPAPARSNGQASARLSI